jgi:hypothetical protein
MPAPTPTSNRIGFTFLGGICPGTTISLNIAVAPFVGVEGFCLTTANPTGVIPPGLSKRSMDGLQKAFDQGAIVLGSTPVTPHKAVGPIEAACQALDAAENTGEASKVLAKLASSTTRSLAKRISLLASFTEVLDYELRNKNRSDIVELIRKSINKMEGVSPIRESVEREVRLVLNPDQLPDVPLDPTLDI